MLACQFNSMQLSFHGAAREVTGSCHLLTALDASGTERRILIDCGMFQGKTYADPRNNEPFGFDPETLDAVLVTHAHADHTGRLPKLVGDGYAGRIVMTNPTSPLMMVVLEDAYHIMEENARRSGEPMLYTKESLEQLHAHCEMVNYHEEVTVAPGITAMFHEAGHILGSAFISIEAEGKRIVFSGDIGNDGVPILPDTEPISKSDVVVCESTYGNRLHEPRPEGIGVLVDCIKQVIERKGTLMIPAFSLERTQELLYELNNLLLNDLKTDMPIFLDSPMAIRATELYRHYKNYLKFDAPIFSDPDRDFFSFPNLKESLRTDDSKFINDAPAPKVVIAGSGMMSGGRIMHHAERYLGDPNSILLIIGFMAEGTLGRALYDGAKRVKVYGSDVEVKAQVKAIGAFSAHGDQEKLTRWLKPEFGEVAKKIFLVHGDPDAEDALAGHLRETYGSEVLTSEQGITHEI